MEYVVEVDVREVGAVAIRGPQLEPTEKTSALVRQHYVVAIHMTLQHTENAAEQPAVVLVIELDQREDQRTVELVSRRSVFMPSLPFLLVARPNFQRLVNTVPARKVKLVIFRRIDLPDIAKQNVHTGTIDARSKRLPCRAHRLSKLVTRRQRLCGVSGLPISDYRQTSSDCRLSAARLLHSLHPAVPETTRAEHLGFQIGP